MANAYYKLISDFKRREESNNAKKKAATPTK